MSFTAGRVISPENAEKLRHINAVLQKLSQDEDLHDDFKLAPVKIAIDHWTGIKRLDVEKAQQLQNNRRVVYVLQRFQMLQSVCKEAGMPVPLDHLLLGKTTLDASIVEKYFGDAIPPKMKEKPANQKTIQLTDTPKSKIPVEMAQMGSSESLNTSAPEHEIQKHGHRAPGTVSAKYDVNTILKVAIAVVFVLIAVTLAQLM